MVEDVAVRTAFGRQTVVDACSGLAATGFGSL